MKCAICKNMIMTENIHCMSVNDMCICKECHIALSTNDMYIAPDYVIDNIYIGSDQSANNCDKMKELGITHVIIVGSELSCRFPKHFKYMHVSMYDTEDENLLRYLYSTTDYMKSIYESDKTNKILIHCSAGISRSASIVIAYLLRYTSMNHYDDAFMFLREIRPIINPNANFVKQLKIFASKYMHIDEVE